MRRRDYSDLAVPGVAGLLPYTPGKPIAELEREYGVSDSIKLASNENPLGASPKALAAMRDQMEGVWLYPDANGFDLKQALAQRHGVSPDCVTLGNGSNDVLVFLAQAFLRPGLEAVFSQYCFAVYPIACRMVGATSRVVPALPFDHPMPLGHDLRGLYQAISGETRMVFVANPNNPTGTWLDGQRLKDFAASLPPNVLCVVDEAYAEYADGETLGDATQWLEEIPNLIVTRTFSKAFGLAGMRVGYALSNPGIADLLNRVRPAFNVNSLALAGAQAALEDVDFITRSQSVNERGLRQLNDGFRSLGLGTLPSAANFVLVDFKTDAAPVNEALLQAGVIVRPVANYGLPNHLRITVGTSEQNDRLLSTLSGILSRQ
jgi:histidinol-phosphate aminotransferase